MKSRLLAMAVVTIAVLLAGFILGMSLSRLINRKTTPAILDTASVVQQVQSLSHLVTVKYVIEKVVVLEDVKWFGESRVLLLAHGVVKAGVDLGGLKPGDVKIHEKKISLRLPPEHVTDVYLDEKRTEIIERSTGLLRLFDKDLEQNARRQAVDDIRRAARASGILKDARERAHLQLGNLLRNLGFAEVEFVE